MNKIVSIVLFILLHISCLIAESGDTIFISNSGEIDLTDDVTLWRYHSGDDPSWASPDFDDRKWELVDPYLAMDTPEAQKWKGIGWFRKVIRIDSSFQNKYIGLYIHHDGASEIFLNGKKIISFGNVSDSKQGELFFDPNLIPFVFSFDSSTVYTLAIRYSNHSNIGWEYLYNKFYGHLGFFLSIFDFNSTIESEYLRRNKRIAIGWGLIGFALAFSLTFFLLYFFYSKRKLNLYFALFTFGISLIVSSFFLELMWYHNLEILVLFRLILFVGISLTFTFFLLFIYQIVYRKIIKVFWFFCLAFVVVNLVAFFSTQYIFNHIVPLGIIIAIMIVESLRVLITGIKRNIEYIWILSIGGVLFLIFTTLDYLLPERLYQWGGYILEILNVMVLPVFMAIYLAKSYGKTQNDLEEKIITVQELSEKQIEQEKKNAELQLQAELERAENERKTRELEQARKLQLSMLPKDIPLLPKLDIDVYMKTATEVGGDYYDFYLDSDGILTAVIGDATGHGLNAGMMVSVTKGLFQSLASRKNLKISFKQLNDSIISMNLQPMYMSLSSIRFINNQLQFVAAGMPPSLFYKKETNTVTELESSGPPLGGFPNFNYDVQNFDFSKGDVIVLLTDGFSERMNEKKQILGWNRGRDLLSGITHLDSEKIIEEFVKAGDEWGGDRQQDDDVTFIIIKIK